MLNDKVETLAVKQTFNNQAMNIPSSSTKSMVGHPQGASGALGVTVSAMSLKNDIMTPTINMENPDPEYDMDYVSNVGREAKLNVAISNCISFGSKNFAIVLKKFP